MGASLKILSIGTATQDVFLMGGKVFRPVCEHGVCYEHLPLGVKLDIEEVVFATGGNSLNAAVTFARQGLDSIFMGVIGTDPAGEAVLRAIDKENIDTKYLRQHEDQQTSYSTILLAPTGERTILNYHGVKLRADGSDLHLQAIADVDWVYLSSLGSMTLLERIITLAAKNGVKVALNPSNSELQDIPKLRSLLDDVTVLITNKEEMKQIVHGETGEELVRHAVQQVPVAVVSDGPKGVWASDGKQLVKAGVYEDVKVVDRLGAGDAFGSGFVTRYAEGKDLATAVTFASANATSVVTKVGATTAILYRNAHVHDMSLKVSEL